MPYRISYLKPRLLIQPQNSRMKSPNQTEIAYLQIAQDRSPTILSIEQFGEYLYLINEQFAYICCC